jgi:hypothetical protein
MSERVASFTATVSEGDLNVNPLHRCFMIFDLYLYDEMAREEDLILYCYPPLPLKQQTQLQGSYLEMIEFHQNVH